MVCGLGRKLQIGHRISLTTLHLVYILFDNTKYGCFVLYLIYKGLLKGCGQEKRNIPGIYISF